MIVDKINSYLMDENRPLDEALLTSFTVACRDVGKKLLFTEDRDSKGKIYMSNSGRCVRQGAYQYLGYKVNGREIDSRSRFNFFMGDVFELGIKYLARASGVEFKTSPTEQQKLVINLGEAQVSGRPDDVLADGTLVEYKSYNEIGYNGLWNYNKTQLLKPLINYLL